VSANTTSLRRFAGRGRSSDTAPGSPAGAGPRTPPRVRRQGPDLGHRPGQRALQDEDAEVVVGLDVIEVGVEPHPGDEEACSAKYLPR
jgi:hypothetical protein